MPPTYKCILGGDTENIPRDGVNEDDGLCGCDMSCEPHTHEEETYILCMHDGETDHGHCPNNTTGGFVQTAAPYGEPPPYRNW